MTSRVTVTLTICLMAAIAAGIALTRPASQPVDATAAGGQAAAAPLESDSGGYGIDQPQAPAESAAPQQAAAAAIEIEGFDFTVPSPFAPGQNITVANLDGAPHTLTAVNGEFDTGTLDGGASGSLTLPDEPGSFDFFCAIHPAMTGTLTIAG